MGIPYSIQTTKPGSGEWFVYRSIIVDPRKLPGYTCSVCRKFYSKVFIQEISKGRPAAMMKKSCYGFHLPVAKLIELLRDPPPVCFAILQRLMFFPQNRIAYSADAQAGEQVDVFRAVIMPGIIQLIAVAVIDPVDTAFNTAPDFRKIWQAFFRPLKC